MSAPPTATAARFPANYGPAAAGAEDLLLWHDVAAMIAASPNYWLATTTEDGRPHLRPVDGVFVDDTLAFGGSPETRWVRHLLRRAGVSVSLPDAEHAVVLEGEVELVTDSGLAIAETVRAANAAKYPQYDTAAPGLRPFWALRPRRVYAWALTGFPDRATRFDFAHEGCGSVGPVIGTS